MDIELKIYDKEKIQEMLKRANVRHVPVAELRIEDNSVHQIFLCQHGRAHFRRDEIPDREYLITLLTEDQIAEIEDTCAPILKEFVATSRSRRIHRSPYISCPYVKEYYSQ